MKKSAVIGLLLAVVEGRKQLVKYSGDRIKPKLSASSAACDDVCIFEDDDKKNYWCFEFEDPHVKAGWEFVQNLAETDHAPAREYFQIDLRFYIETWIEMTSTFNLPRLYYNEFKYELEKFQAYIWVRSIINEHWQYCFGVGWGNEAIDMTFQMIHKMAQCYKVIINDTCTFEDVWYGRNAKIFEDCELSQDGSSEKKLEFYTLELVEKQTDMTWMGTAQPYSDAFCKPLPLIGETTTGGARDANIAMWAKSAYGLAHTWVAARNNVLYSGEHSFAYSPADYIPHYDLPW